MKYVTGEKGLMDKLRDVKKTVAKKAIRKGSRAGAKIVQSLAKEKAPVKTGALKQAVKVRSLPRSRRYTGTQVTTAVADGGVFYGAFIELGTKKMKAKAFIRGALLEAKGAAGSAFIAGIKEVLSEVKK